MWKLLQLIFLGHSHKWKTISEYPSMRTRDETVVARGHAYILQCEGCGKMKEYDTLSTSVWYL